MIETWIWPRLIASVAFLCVTYIPLQIAAIWRQRGFGRVGAVLPLLVMVPMIYGACQPAAYRDGSLFGMYFFCPYLPVMLYLAALATGNTAQCVNCGQTILRRSFRGLPRICPHCGKDRKASASSGDPLGSDHS
jgi:hypothetical protein